MLLARRIAYLKRAGEKSLPRAVSMTGLSHSTTTDQKQGQKAEALRGLAESRLTPADIQWLLELGQRIRAAGLRRELVDMAVDLLVMKNRG